MLTNVQTAAQPASIPPGQPAIAPPIGAGIVPASASLPTPPAAGQPVQPVETPPVAPVREPENGAPGGAMPALPAHVDDAALQTIKKSVIQYLAQMARFGRDPHFHADMALEMIDTGDETAAPLLRELTTAKDFNSWFADLQKVDPMIITQRAWFSDFYEAVKANLAGQAEAEHGQQTTT